MGSAAGGSDLLDEIDDADLFPEPAGGLKIGGWPLCVQGEVDWSGLEDVEFALQIDGEDRTGFTFRCRARSRVARSKARE